MLTIDVNNFRGIKNAHMGASPIALLCGPNAQGKSSIIEAVAALLDGDKAPYGLKKDDADLMLHTGAETAMATLMVGNNERSMQCEWPAAEPRTNGAPLRATKFATGTLRFTSLAVRERQKVLAQYLQTEPTREEFDAALAELALGTDALGALWTDTKQLGWDGAWEKHKTEGTKLKGAWEAVTGGTYGSKVGGTWRPKGWTDEHEAITDEQLKQEGEEAAKALEAAIGTVAINDDERKRLTGLVAQIPKLQELQKTRAGDATRTLAVLKKAEAAILAIPVLPPENWPTCPHCEKPVQIMGTNQLLKAPKALSAKDRTKIQDQVSEAERVLQEAKEANEAAIAAHRTVTADLQKATESKEQLENASDGPKVNLDEFKAEARRVESIKGAKDKIRTALQRHIAVTHKIAVVNALSPEGLRKTKMADKIGKLNGKLQELCTVAGWGAVGLDAEGAALLADTPYALCSGSEQMRIDITLQVAFSMMDGSEVLLIDEADVLDGRGRNGLFKLLAHSERYAIVAMMLVKRSEAPDLDAAQLGETYWVAGALTQPLAAGQKAA